MQVQGDNVGKTLLFKDRKEIRALRDLMYQSMMTTLQSYFKVGRLKLTTKHGWRPGNYPVPDKERPIQFKANNHNFLPFYRCVREEGCCMAASGDESVRLASSSKVPERLEHDILKSISTAKTVRGFKNLLSTVPQANLGILQQLRRDGKIKFNEFPNRPSTKLTSFGKRRLIFLQKQMRKKGGADSVDGDGHDRAQDSIQTGTDREQAPKATVRSPTLDQAFMVKVNGGTGADGSGGDRSNGGIILYFLPNEEKRTQTGPFSADLFERVITNKGAAYPLLSQTLEKNLASQCPGFRFKKRAFDLYLNNEQKFWPLASKEGGQAPGRSFAVCNLANAGQQQDELFRELGRIIVDCINQRHKLKKGQPYDIVELAPNFLIDGGDSVFADYMGVKHAYKMLMNHYRKDIPKRYYHEGYPAEDEDTWGKSNLPIIKSFFHPGSLKPYQAAFLGLPEEWVHSSYKGMF